MKRRRGDVRRALPYLPKELYESYDEVMDRIWRQDVYDLNLAKQVLGWISRAKRPLTVIELQHVIAFTGDSVEIDEADLYAEAELVSVCAGIVTVDPKSNIIRLVHYTTQEYFERIDENKFPVSQATIAKTCLTYLGLIGFDGPCHHWASLEDRLEKYKFSQYAAQFWGHHTRGEPEKEPDIQRAVLSFLASENKKNSMLQLENRSNSSWGNFTFTKGQTLLHVITKNGLATICKRLLPRRGNENDTYVLEVDI